MPAKVLLLLPALLLLTGFAYSQPDQLTAAYNKADKMFNSTNPTAVSDSLAMEGFAAVIRQLEKKPAQQYASMLFQSYLKEGILLDVKNSTEAARNAYLQAIRV